MLIIELIMSIRIKGIKQIVDRYTTFLFDLDGWKGDQGIQNSIECLKYLRQQKKRLFFITNSSVRNREEIKEKFKKFGFNPNIEQIFTSSFITGLYLKKYHPQIKNIVCLGTQSLANQLRLNDLDVHQLELPFQNIEISKLKTMLDLSRQAIVVGYDKSINLNKITKLSMYLQNGLSFFGTNPDKYTMIDDYKVPGAGTIIQAIKSASGKQPYIIGKPNPFILKYILSTYNIKNQECLMIGDNLETDILFAKNSQIDSLCVLTGVSALKDVVQSQTIVPKYFSQYL